MHTRVLPLECQAKSVHYAHESWMDCCSFDRGVTVKVVMISSSMLWFSACGTQSQSARCNAPTRIFRTKFGMSIKLCMMYVIWVKRYCADKLNDRFALENLTTKLNDKNRSLKYRLIQNAHLKRIGREFTIICQHFPWFCLQIWGMEHISNEPKTQKLEKLTNKKTTTTEQTQIQIRSTRPIIIERLIEQVQCS